MSNNYLIIDNFLSISNSQYIKDTLCQDNFAWNYRPGITRGSNDIDVIKHHNNRPDIFQKQVTDYKNDDFMFTHLFFMDNPFFMSQGISLMYPILSQLKIEQLLRIKANFYTRTDKNVSHDWHVDRDDEHFNAIYYVNTNNGKTILKDVAEIESIQNRIVIFKGDVLHASTTSTNINRVNINFNFKSNHKIEEMDFVKKKNKISYK